MIERKRDAHLHFFTASRSAQSMRLSYSKGFVMPVSEIGRSPAFDAQAADPAKLGQIAGNEDRLFVNRVRCNQ